MHAVRQPVQGQAARRRPPSIAMGVGGGAVAGLRPAGGERARRRSGPRCRGSRSAKPSAAARRADATPTVAQPAPRRMCRSRGLDDSRQLGRDLRFRELTTLQQWIVERKVTRDDEISRSGDQWKRLGGIAELASFFHIVEQAAAVARADGPRAAAEAANAAYARRQPRDGDDNDPALVTTAPMARERPAGRRRWAIPSAATIRRSRAPTRRRS